MADKEIIFIAFAIEDEAQRNLLTGQSLHTKCPIEYIDYSVKTAYESDWKDKVRTRIRRAAGVIVLVSKNSLTSTGQKWEIECAKEEKKPIYAIWAITRLAFAAILPDQKHGSAIQFFHLAQAFSRFGISPRRVLTDNGPCYRDYRFQKTLRMAHLKHRFTRPYTPRTNGKAETLHPDRAARMSLRALLSNSREREQQLDSWLHDYNFHRPHTSLNLKPPVSRAGLHRNNLLSLHN